MMLVSNASVTMDGMTRFSADPTNWSVSWVPSIHVVIQLFRESFNGEDTLEDTANLRNIRLELSR